MTKKKLVMPKTELVMPKTELVMTKKISKRYFWDFFSTNLVMPKLI